MKTLGIVGGIGPESTVEYYRGGTELPLILRDETHGGIPLLDTTRIHVNAAVAQL